jgi:signal transduction histidine kinase
VALLYLVFRTWATVRSWHPQLRLVWPYVDVIFISAGLIVLRDPTDALGLVYFVSLASAVAAGRLLNLVGVAGAATAGLFLVIIRSDVPWTVSMVYRLIVIGVMASIYGWVIRTVALYERAAERAAYQKDLAREIHDGIQYLLAAISARLELADRLVVENPGRAQQILTEEREAVRRAGDELRYLVRRLRAEAQQTDLATALRRQVASLAGRWAFDVEMDVPDRLPRLSPAGRARDPPGDPGEPDQRRETRASDPRACGADRRARRAAVRDQG